MRTSPVPRRPRRALPKFGPVSCRPPSVLLYPAFTQLISSLLPPLLLKNPFVCVLQVVFSMASLARIRAVAPRRLVRHFAVSLSRRTLPSSRV
jgi:hypothetical protein